MSERAEFFIQGEDLLAEPYHYLASGLDNIFLLNGVTEENTDYGPMVHIENINGLHHAIGLHIVEKTGLMTGAEFRFLRKQLHLSQAELGRVMSVTDQTIANYEKEKSGIGPAGALIRTLYLLDILPEETRVKMIRRLIDLQQKLPDVPRQKIVERWREGDDGKLAA
jgi:transcriptional regulator with XRE-family HTH domain